MPTATLTPATANVEILEGVYFEQLDGSVAQAALVNGEGYWLTDRVTHVTVAREDGSAEYRVDLSGRNNKPCSCTCKDRAWRQRTCKHMQAAAELGRRW